MIELFTVLVVPLAILLMGLLAYWIGSKLVGAEKGRVAALAVMVGYILGGANHRTGDFTVTEMVAVVFGLAILWWVLFKRETIGG